MLWMIFIVFVLVVSGAVGLHLRRFSEAYTEMTGMMVGMTMGMLNGFVLGYAAAAATKSLFWGDLFGILLGLALGGLFGRAGGLMGVMDGSMGGLMGGSMGAMLAVMLIYPPSDLIWTATLLSAVYLVGMAVLIVLIERSAPELAARHALFPWFTKALEEEVAEQLEKTESAGSLAAPRPQIANYYEFLGLEPLAPSEEEIMDAYLVRLAAADEAGVRRIEQAVSILTDPTRRQAYDKRLKDALIASGELRADCCPPPRKKRPVAADDAPAPALATPPVTQATPAALSAAAPAATEQRAPAATVPVRATERAQAPQPPAKNRAGDARPRPQQPAPAGRPGESRQTQTAQAQKDSAQARAGTQAGQPARKGGNKGSRPAQRRQQKAESPVSWVGIAAATLVVIFVVAWWVMGHNGGSGTYANSQGAGQGGNTSGALQVPADQLAQLESRATSPQLGSDGKQNLDFVVNGDSRSYQPSVIRVKQGVPVHFNMSVQGKDPGCGRYVGMRGLGVHGIVTPGQTSAMDFTPTQAGVYEINCNMNMMVPGYLIVAQ